MPRASHVTNDIVFTLKISDTLQVRVNGSSSCAGRVEVLFNGQWGHVCSYAWDLPDAEVVCKQLDCGSAISAPHLIHLESLPEDRVLTGVKCRGNETELSQCEAATQEERPCQHEWDGGVICATHLQPRLVSSEDPCSGRVEVQFGETWGTICDSSWDIKDANVVCHELQCGVAVATAVGALYGKGTGPAWNRQFECMGNESILFDCPQSQPLAENCSDSSDMSIICSEHHRVRLAGLSSQCAGRVEVYHRAIWGTVCDKSWDLVDAQIVCRQLGCGTAVRATVLAEFGEGSGPVWLDDVNCHNYDFTLWDCPSADWGESKCLHRRDAGVVCSGDIKMRFMSFVSTCTGRVEIYYRGQWGTVCFTGLGMREAHLICKQMNCGEAETLTRFHIPPIDLPILKDRVRCSGNETFLWECPSDPWGQHDCDHMMDTAVICKAHIKPRLFGDKDPCSGRVEVQFGETWGTFCDSNLDMEDANVVCHQLQCGVAVATSTGVYDEGSGPVWDRQFECKGNESILYDCPQSPPKAVNCTHRRDAGVICSGKGGPRLVGGASRCSGRVEILYDNTWGTLCDKNLDLQTADVICKHLYCGAAVSTPSRAHFGEGKGPIWRDSFQCNGNESRLGECTVSWDKASCDHSNDASIICSDADWQLQLKGGESRCEGTVQVMLNGTWRQILDSEWDLQDASVVCAQLNCGQAVKPQSISRYISGRGSVILTDINCAGDELSLQNCYVSVMSELFNISDSVGVFCSEHTKVRLAGHSSQCTGRVEVYYNATWGTVGSNSWDLTDAQVVCRQLGCGNAVRTAVSAEFGKGSGPVWLDEVKCRGDELALWKCPSIGWRENNYEHKEDAGVVCSEFKDLRLVSAEYVCAGKLEVFYNGTWGDVCSNGMDSVTINIICQQLRCGDSGLLEEGKYDEASNKVKWLDGVTCYGHELAVWQCPSLPWGENRCQNGEEARIRCSAATERPPTTASPERSTMTASAQFEMCTEYGKNYEAVYEEIEQKANVNLDEKYDSLNDVSTTEYKNVEIPEKKTTKEQPDLDTNYDDTETQDYVNDKEENEEMVTAGYDDVELLKSPSSEEQLKLEIFYDDVDVEDYANKKEINDIKMQLMSISSTCTGRVEFYYRGQWGTVCSTGMEMREAHLVCKQMNCGEAETLTRFHIPALDLPIWKNKVRCSGNETFLWECPSDPLGQHDCDHMMDMTVVCKGALNISLENGGSPCAGQMLVRSTITQISPADEIMEIPMANVVCTHIGSHIKPRLFSDEDPCSGRVEVQFGETWGTFCDSNWDVEDANVVCHQLQCGVAVATSTGVYGEGSGPVWDRQFECKGNESILYDCPQSPPKAVNCTHRRDAGVICSGKGGPRLVGGASRCSGRVEILYENIWGTLCDKNLDLQTADVICRHLYCGAAVSTPSEAYFGKGKGPMWRDNFQCNGNESRLGECAVSWDKASCDHSNDASIICSEADWQFQLKGGESRCEGTLQVLLNGTWRRILDPEWDLQDASVVCAQLNCGQALKVQNISRYISGSGPVILTDINCAGDELSLQNCSISVISEQFNISGGVGILCSEHKKVRLADHSSQCAGRVEVYYNATWGSVSSNSWDLTDAQVVCRQLGCGTAVRTAVPAEFGKRSEPVWLDEVNCRGDELALWKCPSIGWQENNYQHKEDAGVVCSGDTGDIKMQLMSASSTCTGKVEIYYRGQWGTVCFTGLGMREAHLICKQMNCGEAETLTRFHIPPIDLPIWKDRVRCFGNETFLWECPSDPWGQHDCDHMMDTAVICKAHIKPRLFGDEDTCSGRMEVQFGETWGTFCDSNLDMEDANVVCHQLQCGVAVATLTGVYGEGSGPVWDRQFECKGNESILYDCPQSPPKAVNCTHRRDAGVICSGKGGPRLVGGVSRCSGRVEILYDNNWGTLCDKNLDLRAADVICRHLYCGAAVSTPSGSYFGKGKGPIWRENFQCNGNESRLGECAVSWDKASCDHSNDASIICSDADWQLQLKGGESRCEGTVQVMLNGTWRGILYPEWDMQDASVVCAQLNCGQAVKVQNISRYISGSGPVILTDINCAGDELSLQNCSISVISEQFNISGGVGILCSEHKKVRLAGHSSQCAGRVEVYYNATWGTVGSNSWDLTDAQVVCRQLGCGTAVRTAVSAEFGKGSGPVWLDEVKCRGDELALWKCPSIGWRDNNYEHKQDAGVVCSELKELRLVSAEYVCAGKLEVFYNGTWGDVCSNRMDSTTVSIICQQLGCGDSGLLEEGTHEGASNKVKWLDGVTCYGHERVLWQCSSLPWGKNRCQNGDEARIRCSAATERPPTTASPERSSMTESAQVETCTEYGKNYEAVYEEIEQKANVNLDEKFDSLSYGNAFEDGRKSTILNRCENQDAQKYQTGNEAEYNDIEEEIEMNTKISINEVSPTQYYNFGIPEKKMTKEQPDLDTNYDDTETQDYVNDKEENEEMATAGYDDVQLLDSPSSEEQLKLEIFYDDVDVEDYANKKEINGPFQVRLEGNDPCAGRIQIFYDGQWGHVCSYSWDQPDAEVVCRQLGCGAAVFAPHYIHSESLPEDQILTVVKCYGNETNLRQCDSRTRDEIVCQHKWDAGVICASAVNISLASGASPCAGRMLIKTSSGTATFRDEVVKTPLANVVCTQLGSHVEPRLVSSKDPCAGRMEVQFGETWGTFCDFNWDIEDANVVCHQLQCGVAVSTRTGVYGEGSGPVWNRQFECNGNESILFECPQSAPKAVNCTHRNDVGVICSGRDGPRLVGGSSRCSGRVEVLHKNVWGTLCDKNLDLKAANVICRHLLCGEAISTPSEAYFGEGMGQVWKDTFLCNGNESRLEQCVVSWDKAPCDHRNDASIICSDADWQLQLKGGESHCEGTVQVMLNGTWRQILDSEWDLQDASVVCAQLNCGQAVIPQSISRYISGSGPVILTDINCAGDELSLQNCSFLVMSEHFNISGGVGVLCSEHNKVRLAGHSSQCAGRVEVYYNATWGTVCSNSWELTDAQVVCRQLGCGNAVRTAVSAEFGKSSGPVLLDEVKCWGNESAIWKCPSRSWGENKCQHKDDAGVVCSEEPLTAGYDDVEPFDSDHMEELSTFYDDVDVEDYNK
ncbi:DMBT1 protein, partial [Polypterus senegalus]